MHDDHVRARAVWQNQEAASSGRPDKLLDPQGYAKYVYWRTVAWRVFVFRGHPLLTRCAFGVTCTFRVNRYIRWRAVKLLTVLTLGYYGSKVAVRVYGNPFEVGWGVFE